jgi:cytochrome c-type biogenesis protein
LTLLSGNPGDTLMIIMMAIVMLLGLDVQIQLWLAPLFPSFAI